MFWIQVMIERIDLELHDYPPSGANGRHTPRGPYPWLLGNATLMVNCRLIYEVN